MYFVYKQQQKNQTVYVTWNSLESRSNFKCQTAPQIPLKYYRKTKVIMFLYFCALILPPM